MNDIRGLGRGGYLPQALRGGLDDGSRLALGLAEDAAPEGSGSGPGSITNGRGETLFDIRDQLKAAVIDALASIDPSGDRGAAMRDAVRSTLEANGFDPAALDAARIGFGPMRSGPAGPGPLAAVRQAVDGLDLDAVFGDKDEDEQRADDFLQTLLGQLRPGTNLDLEI